MRTLYEDMTALPALPQGTVLAIGNFDGVHPGHAALVKRAQDIAAAQKLHAAVLTFEPHPREFFLPDGDPFRLTLLPEKARRLMALGAGHIFAPAFDAGFAGLSATDFMGFLRDRLHARHVVVGADFAFGKNRSGNVDSLREMFDVTVIDPVTCGDGAAYSSTRIRDLLRRGDLAGAAQLLGRPWEIEAEIVHGDKRGRELGYPTANQQVDRYVRIPYGIYAVRARIEGEEKPREAVANFGIRPMFRIRQPIFETHIFDFHQSIYGKILRVEPVKYLRPEKIFDGLEPLIAQMKQDCLAARAVFKS
ncbi:MAG: bifunctional riboflavin kinase/FAD synthetase [Alphaproteobacteria bacterium]